MTHYTYLNPPQVKTHALKYHYRVYRKVSWTWLIMGFGRVSSHQHHHCWAAFLSSEELFWSARLELKRSAKLLVLRLKRTLLGS